MLSASYQLKDEQAVVSQNISYVSVMQTQAVQPFKHSSSATLHLY
jgi:hypothetical protein